MIRKRGQLSRIDILQAKLQVDTETATYIAQQLGLNKVSRSAAPELKDPDKKRPSNKKPFLPELKATKPSDRPKTNFWYCQQREQNNRNNKENKKPISVSVPWNNRPKQQPQHIPLLADKALLAKLQPYLNQEHPSLKVDVSKVIHTLSRGEYLSRVPRKLIKKQQLTLHIIDDRSRHLNTYWHDHHQVSQLISQAYPQSRLSLSVLIDSENKPQQITPQGFADWQVEDNSTVLILSDLGVLKVQASRASSLWLSIGRELQRKHCQTIVMLPCAVPQIPPNYQSLFQLLSWESTLNSYLDTVTINSQVESLLTALSPAIRIEPELLRSMRLAMQVHGKKWQLPILVESYLWQHAAIQEPHSVAASWASEMRQDYLNGFANLTKPEKHTALETIRAWRSTLSEKIWYEEIMSLDEEAQQLNSIQEDVQQAKIYFEAFNTSFEYDEIEPEQSTQAWFKRFYHRIPKRHIQASSTLQQISAQVFKDDTSFNPQWIDPQNLPKNKKAIKQAVLYQKGNQLYLKRYNAFDLPPSSYSPLALIKLRLDYVQVLFQGAVLGILSLNNQQRLPLTSQNLEIKSDEETLFLQTQICPENGAMGRDQYGLFADIDFSGITQRFRYIEPGTFMMGSPKDEKGRYESETYNQVTLTKGYWMADTACTQELWQAVMGDNPAGFKYSEQNPIEQVSWLDTQKFINKLNQQTLQLQAQLPTEAQWEYACRAGTQTPFNFEGGISLDKVNYRGTDDYDKWGGGAKKETVAVKEHKQNVWGLYQMHGNVDEWCQDEGSEGEHRFTIPEHPKCKFDEEVFFDLLERSLSLSLEEKQRVIDLIPKLSQFKIDELTKVLKEEKIKFSTILTKAELDYKGVYRVLRGGSWLSLGGLCRSAICRTHTAGSSSQSIGFRLSLGHELQPSPVLILKSMPWGNYQEKTKKDKTYKRRLALLEQCREAFEIHSSFMDMSKPIRKMIAGLPSEENIDSAWFGSMKGAGKFHKLINDNDKDISYALDLIPLQGEVTKSHYDAFIEVFLSSFSKEKFKNADKDGGGGISIATRLLAMKRPDYFICISSSNKNGLANALKVNAYSLSDPQKYWNNVVVSILNSEWWNSPEPVYTDNEMNHQFWLGRVAMLDTLWYETTETIVENNYEPT